MTCTSRFLPLYIRCTVDTRQDFEAANGVTLPDAWFALLSDKQYVRLLVQPDKYTPVREEIGDRLKYISSLAGQYAPVASAHPSFRVTVTNPDSRLRDLVEFIADRCTSDDLQEHRPLEIIDFVKPDKNRKVGEGRRLFASNGEPYTVRVGRIVNFEEEQGNVRGSNGHLYAKGFTLVFQEQQKRRVLG